MVLSFNVFVIVTGAAGGIRQEIVKGAVQEAKTHHPNAIEVLHLLYSRKYQLC